MIGQTGPDIVPEYCTKPVVVFGCGNVLWGDDGFGPAVVEALRTCGAVPAWAEVIDAGTAVREFLFDIALCEERPALIVVIDAVDIGRPAGEVFEISLDDIPVVKVAEYSLHQAPTANLLRQLQEHCGVDIAVVACQVDHVPDEIRMGLSPNVRDAVARAAQLIAERFLKQDRTVRAKGVDRCQKKRGRP